MRAKLRTIGGVALAWSVFAGAGCEQLFQKDSERAISAGDKKAAAGDFRFAIKLYEAALDGTAKTADVHYKLAMIYDDKLKDPLNALHHFNRYLELAPNGSHAKEAKAFQKDGRQRLGASLNRGSLITLEEAVRIKKENFDLKMQIVALRAEKGVLPAAPVSGAKGEPVQKPIPAGARKYVVQPGDTLGSIAAKFYKNKARWKRIQDANYYPTTSTVTIKPGQTLVIP